MRIGILGGTFDPPHAGHIALAEAAVAQLELDEVIFVPASRNPLKEVRSSHPKDRLEMTRRAISRFEKFCVSDIEIARGGKSYTIETLTELQIAHPGEYWIIMGTDALREFPRWKTPDKILLKARLSVALRAPQKREEILQTWAGVGEMPAGLFVFLARLWAPGWPGWMSTSPAAYRNSHCAAVPRLRQRLPS